MCTYRCMDDRHCRRPSPPRSTCTPGSRTAASRSRRCTPSSSGRTVSPPRAACTDTALRSTKYQRDHLFLFSELPTSSNIPRRNIEWFGNWHSCICVKFSVKEIKVYFWRPFRVRSWFEKQGWRILKMGTVWLWYRFSVLAIVFTESLWTKKFNEVFRCHMIRVNEHSTVMAHLH